jgi:hypothetical protein
VSYSRWHDHGTAAEALYKVSPKAEIFFPGITALRN